MSVGPPVAVNIDFCGYLRFLSISFAWSIRVQYTTDNLSGQQFYHFIGQCLYFNPRWTAGQAINKGELCLEQHDSLKEMCSCYVSTYKSGFLEGFRRWRRSILSALRNPDLHGSCSLIKHCGISDRTEQNSSKLRHTVCDVFISR